MQFVLPWKDSIIRYKIEFENIEFEMPARCVECGCGKFHKWGKYARYVIEEHEEYPIYIQRIRCVKCLKTCSYLPSFCLSGLCYGLDFVMKILSVLLLKIPFSFGDMRRRAYAFLQRFVRSENLWLVFLRGAGFGGLPEDKKKRRLKIFTALLKVYHNGNLLSSFFQATGRHFMSAK
jgi:hypothetical protein